MNFPDTNPANRETIGSLYEEPEPAGFIFSNSMEKLFLSNGGNGCSLPCKFDNWTFCDIKKSPLVERTSLGEDGYINSAALEIAADAIILAG